MSGIAALRNGLCVTCMTVSCLSDKKLASGTKVSGVASAKHYIDALDLQAATALLACVVIALQLAGILHITACISFAFN